MRGALLLRMAVFCFYVSAAMIRMRFGSPRLG